MRSRSAPAAASTSTSARRAPASTISGRAPLTCVSTMVAGTSSLTRRFASSSPTACTPPLMRTRRRSRCFAGTPAVWRSARMRCTRSMSEETSSWARSVSALAHDGSTSGQARACSVGAALGRCRAHSSVTKGMNGCSRRRMTSRAVTAVHVAAPRDASSTPSRMRSFAISTYQSQ